MYIGAESKIGLNALLLLTGCASTANKAVNSASGKNVEADGYTMIGRIDTANAETATPQGVLIIGNVTYKSRKVGIPADQKTPNAGSYKRVKRVTLFGTEETTTTWDYTAGSDKDAETALKAMLERQKAEADADKKESPPPEANE